MIDTIEAYFSDKLSTIDFVLLYGSYAQAKATPMSDIDIAIHFKTPSSVLEMGGYTTYLEMQLHKKIEINTLNHLYKTHPLLAYNITTNHIPITIVDENAYIDFKTNSMLYYFDTYPLIQQSNESLKRRIESGFFGERNYA
ncbi:MAG: hypothetical protein KU38_10985 [Sulfurovum sp. FS08-3]|nr:MAG: hypothetical protein KU38_10985 [Sulfurovum sp. FS08-3]